MNKKLAFVFSLFLMMSFCPNNNDVVEVNAAIGTTPTVKYSATLSATYYDDVEGKTGDALLEGLATLTYANHKYYTSYDDIRGGNAYSDRDPNDSTKIIDFYTGWSIPNDWDGGTTWNREHVWCQSLSGGLFGTSGAGSDIHHIRPTISGINSARGNALYTDREHCGTVSLQKYYYTGTQLPQYKDQWTGCYRSSDDYWEPRDEEKGDIARILMYLYMHYSKEVSANSSNSRAGALTITNIVYTSPRSVDAAWDMLVDWNEIDPVSTFEMNRNNYCASVTGNRNPFVDHPEYANAIWGDGTNSGGDDSGNTGGDDSGNTGDNTGGDDSGDIEEDPFVYPEANSLITIKEALEVSNHTGATFTTDKYQVKGIIENIDNTTYGNMTIKDENGDSLYIYGVYSKDGKTRYDALTNKPKVGEEITLLGILGLFNGSPEMKNGWIMEQVHNHVSKTTYDENKHYTICSSCNETLSSGEHTYTTKVVESTCDQIGYTSYTCNCGYSYKVDAESVSHNFGKVSYSWGKNFTVCTATRICKTNSSHKETETVVPTVVTVESTCKVKGSKTYTATFKNEAFATQTYTVELPLAGHNYNEGEVIKEPTLEETGELLLTCLECNETHIEIIDKLPSTSEEPSEVPSEEPSEEPTTTPSESDKESNNDNVSNIINGPLGKGCLGSTSSVMGLVFLVLALLILRRKIYK